MQDKDNWYGTAAPYIDFFVGNGLRMNELRLGHNTANHKGGGQIQEKRGSMAQSLGPMTSFLLHVRKEEKYRRKWTNAAKRTMAHMPIIDEILDATKGENASEIRGVVKHYDMQDKDNWYGTAAPNIDFFVGNGPRMNELD
ncbi:hypothetical protein JTB14_032470 [Gonioctena quinquepunctata]|nr:hypothetical protein JTB14_032470 [Gonioctena quinquepunctata]